MLARVSDPVALLGASAEVAGATDAVRVACLDLRRHPALRRQSAEASAEAVVRAARASAALSGARLPTALVRDAVRGAVPFPDDAAGLTVRGTVRALAALDRIGTSWQRAPLQALATLHVAAAANLVPERALGRPRRSGELPGDGQDLLDATGALIDAPTGAALTARLESLVGLLTTPTEGPALLVAALAHAEVAVARPFVSGNAVVARALCRSILVGRGVDSTGVAIWEAGLLAMGPVYPLTLARYATEGPEGVRAWLTTFARAMTDGVAEGRAVCDAVLAGRLTPESGQKSGQEQAAP
jgi:hypothetical protein